MPAILGSALSSHIADNGYTSPYLKALTPKDWEASIALLLPPEELQAWTNQALDSTFDYVNGRTDSVIVSILPIKAHLVSGSGMGIVKQILRAQPACTMEQLTQIGLALMTGGDISLCNPPEELMSAMIPLLESQFQFITLAFPDEVTLIPATQSGAPSDPRIRLNMARSLMKFSPLLPLAFLIVMTMFTVRSLTDGLKWWGLPFLIIGGISLLAALLGSTTLGLIIQRVVLNQGFGFLPPVLLATMRETVNAVARQILNPVALQGSMLTISGMLVTLVGIYLSKKRSPS
jgi:hypothetical protein